MNTLENLFFSPLGKEYCLLFYYSAIIAFVIFAMGMAGGVYHVMTGRMTLFALVLSLVSPGILYLNNRLLYSMCVNMK
tara:strand:- start:371 stop:604 length:234 start_codon:yes stop_codon:yes gene_type:complete